jgi:DNA-binding HxlR family transcriptional regulator
MPDYGRYCPVSMGSEVLADRWTPLVVRELILGNTRFNDIARGLPGISRSLLVQRLKHLERKGVLERFPLPLGRGYEYQLTSAGRDLEPVVMALGRWAVQWLFHELRPADVDAVTLTWWMHRRIDTTELPTSRVVVQFDHTAPRRQSIWMVLDRGDASVCLQHPGFEPDVIVTATTEALAEVFSGFDTWARAVSMESIRVAGPTKLVRSLPRWFLWSPFVTDVRAVAASR